MSKLFLCFSFLSLFIFKSCEKKTNYWEQLQKAAHQVGLCVYNIEEVYCEVHQSERSKRELSINPEEEELYYFEMKEEWAKARIEGRANSEKHSKEGYLILYDVKQGPFVFKDSSKVGPSLKNFIIVNLKDDFEFSEKAKTDNYSECIIGSKREQSILENFLWREYMSGRQGRLLNSTSFAIVNHTEKENFNNFTDAFFFYQKAKN